MNTKQKTVPYLYDVISIGERHNRFLQVVNGLGYDQHRLQLALEHIHVSDDKGDVE